jgi:hypothetical protein
VFTLLWNFARLAPLDPESNAHPVKEFQSCAVVEAFRSFVNPIPQFPLLLAVSTVSKYHLPDVTAIVAIEFLALDDMPAQFKLAADSVSAFFNGFNTA